MSETSRYLIDLENGTWYVQRKYALKAIDDPMSADENVIVFLCQKVEEKDKEIDRLNKPMCNVCAGDPDFHTKCICGGVGTVWAECEGLRAECISLQARVAELEKQIKVHRGASRGLLYCLDHDDEPDKHLTRMAIQKLREALSPEES